RLSALRRLPGLLLPLHRRRVPDPEGARPGPRSRHRAVLHRPGAAVAAAAVRAPAEPRDADGRVPEGVVSAPSSRLRVVTLAAIGGGLVTLASIVLLPIGVVTLFRARRLYAAVARVTSRAVLRRFGVRLRLHQETSFPRSQTIYISNHTST